MNIAVENLWEEVLSVLKPQLNDESFELWLRPIKPLALDGSRLVLKVPNAFFADWLRDHYQQRLETLLQGAVLTLDGHRTLIVSQVSDIEYEEPGERPWQHVGGLWEIKAQ